MGLAVPEQGKPCACQCHRHGADERYRTTAPGVKTLAFNFVPFRMAVYSAGEHSFLWIPCHCCHDGVALQHSLHPDLAHQQRLLPAPTRRVSQNAVRCCAATLTSPVACCSLPLVHGPTLHRITCMPSGCRCGGTSRVSATYCTSLISCSSGSKVQSPALQDRAAHEGQCSHTHITDSV